LTATSFSIPESAISFWMDRLKAHNVPFQSPAARFNEQALTFSDPDGLNLELVASDKTAGDDRAWKNGPVPPEHGLRGFHNVTLTEASIERTASLLTETMGFHRTEQDAKRVRFEVGTGGQATIVDILSERGAPRGVVSVGSVHHVAWRTPDDAQQKAWRAELLEAGLNVTPVIDRTYFHSIYYREPGGILFEIATDPPGFTVDEPEDQLGTRLALPKWLESERKEIEQALPPVRPPALVRAR
jgi:glyoxalase family protein